MLETSEGCFGPPFLPQEMIQSCYFMQILNLMMYSCFEITTYITFSGIIFFKFTTFL